MRIRHICTAMLLMLCVTLPCHRTFGQDDVPTDRITQLMQDGAYAEARPLLEQVLRDTLLPRNQRANRGNQSARRDRARRAGAVLQRPGHAVKQGIPGGAGQGKGALA